MLIYISIIIAFILMFSLIHIMSQGYEIYHTISSVRNPSLNLIPKIEPKRDEPKHEVINTPKNHEDDITSVKIDKPSKTQCLSCGKTCSGEVNKTPYGNYYLCKSCNVWNREGSKFNGSTINVNKA